MIVIQALKLSEFLLIKCSYGMREEVNMKFMSRKNLAEEMDSLHLQNEESERSNLIWIIIGFAITVGILLLGAVTLAVIPNISSKTANDSSNTSTILKQQN